MIIWQNVMAKFNIAMTIPFKLFELVPYFLVITFVNYVCIFFVTPFSSPEVWQNVWMHKCGKGFCIHDVGICLFTSYQNWLVLLLIIFAF